MDAPAFETLLWQRRGTVLTVTLHRPQALNAMTATMRVELCRAMDLAEADDAVRAIVFTGSGRAFCAGFDLSGGPASFDPATRPAEDGPARDGGGQLALRLFASTKPLIAAVNGAAVGIGASMLLPMDARIASSGAKIGFVFARRGIVPDACASWFLPRAVGLSRALDWALSGRLIGADEAFAGGLLREVCTPESLLERAERIALEMTEASAPVSVALTRQLLWRMQGAAHPMEAHRIESRLIAERGASADAREGVAAFFDKRAPRFPGRVSADLPPSYPWWDEPPFEPAGKH
jgi:enoyl-CoA hydratase/carnithine racemase